MVIFSIKPMMKLSFFSFPFKQAYFDKDICRIPTRYGKKKNENIQIDMFIIIHYKRLTRQRQDKKRKKLIRKTAEIKLKKTKRPPNRKMRGWGWLAPPIGQLQNFLGKRKPFLTSPLSFIIIYFRYQPVRLRSGS